VQQSVPHGPERGLVSVIIPCFNQGHFLPQAIGSVLGQSYRNMEIIVVDDGSTDTTRSVAGRYREVICISQRNQGLSAARNAGLRKARGEYVVLLDADDRLLPDALSIGVREITAMPQLAFVSGHCRLITPDGLPYDEEQLVIPNNHYRALLTHNYIWCPATVLYRASIFKEAGLFDVNLRSCEDYELYLRITRSHPVSSHGNVVAEYRQHRESMSRNAARMLVHALKVLRSQEIFVTRRPADYAAYRRGLWFWRNWYGKQTARNVRDRARRGEWRLALESFLTLLTHHPAGIVYAVSGRWPRIDSVLRGK
jgi:glycosyltransferase involved in cell wall biosynthesis